MGGELSPNAHDRASLGKHGKKPEMSDGHCGCICQVQYLTCLLDYGSEINSTGQRHCSLAANYLTLCPNLDGFKVESVSLVENI